MKRKSLKIFSVLICICMIFTVIPFGTITVSAATYNVSSAVSFANSYWNDGVGLCAEFVSRCLAAGGVTIPNYSYYSSSKQSYQNNSGTLDGYTNPYKCSAALLLYLSEKYTIITNPSSSQISVGDVVFMYGGSSGQWKDGHVGIVISTSGGVPVYAAHNKATNSGKFYSNYPCTYVAKMNGVILTHTINSSYGTNFTAYPKAKITASNIFDEYHNMTSSTAWIGTSDKCTIHEVYTDGCCKVSYPLDSGGTRTVYSKISLFNTHICNYSGARLQEPDHPHIITQRCVDYASCGGYIVTGEYGKLSTCKQCWYATFNVSASSLSLKTGESKSISMSIDYFLPDTKVVIMDYDSSLIEVSISQNTLTFKGLKSGSCTFKFIIYSDSTKSYVIGSKSISVTVTNSTYTLSYNANGGSGAPSSQIIPSSTEDYVRVVLSDVKPTRIGYTFLGWSTNSTATYTPYYPGVSYSCKNSNVILYAVWEPAYNLSNGYNANAIIDYGGQEKFYKFIPSNSGKYVIYSTGTADTKVALYNSNGTLLQSNDDGGENTNFRLEYNLTAGSTYYYGVKYYSSSEYGSINTTFCRLYTISYSANGGTSAPASQIKEHNSAIQLRNEKPQWQGYTFLGWSTSSTATNPSYQSGDRYNGNTDITLYAVWQKGCEGGNHKYSYSVKEAPTISNTGKLTGICSVCSQTTVITLPKLSTTDYTYTVEITPTCITHGAGKYVWKNTTYGTLYFATVIEITAHSFITKTTNPTCTSQGYQTHTCSACGKSSKDNYTNALGHKYDNSCDNKCNTCGMVRTVSHSYYGDLIEPTCTVNGKIVYICEKCGDSYEEILLKTGHEYDNNLDKNCNICGFTREVAHSHVYGDWITETEATTDMDGLKYKICSCGDRVEEVIPRVLTFKNKTLALESNIYIVFRVDPVYFTTHGYTNPVIIFTLNGVEYPVSEYKVNKTSGLYEFAFNGISPHQMKDNVSAVLTAEYDGVTYSSAAQEYSIYTYCNNQISKYYTNTTYKKLVGLLVDILNYGAAAQNYNNYNTSNLANAELTAAQKALGNQDVISYTDEKMLQNTVVSGGLADIKVAGLTLQDSVVITFKFELLNGATTDGLVAHIEAAGQSWNIPSSEFTYETSSRRYVISFNGLNPAQMREAVTINLVKNGKVVSDTATYSVESYGLSTAVKGYAKLASLVEAMARYGRSAKAYNG